MKPLTNHIYWLYAILLLISASGCSSDDNKNEDSGTPAVEASNKICLDWGCSKENVASFSTGLIKTGDTDNQLSYKSPAGDFSISYDFQDGKLRAALYAIQLDDDDSSSNLSSNLKNYQYVGETDGASVYTDSSKNTMAMVMTRNVGADRFGVVGYAPISSEMFEEIEPINVSTLSAENVTSTQMLLKGSFSGITSVDKASFEYTVNPDLSETKIVTASVKGTDFTYTFKTSEPNITLYYRALITFDGILYEGEWENADLEKVTLYKVGDPYPSASSPIGVVWEIKNGGMNGTIISLDQDYLKWDVNGLFCTDYSSYNSSDGSKNNMGSTQPFAKWVRSHGSDWFGPAINQLKISKADLALVNKTLRDLNKTEMDGFYWSSTQKNGNQAYIMTVTETSYMGYSNMHSFYNNKDNSRQVRAMRYF